MRHLGKFYVLLLLLVGGAGAVWIAPRGLREEAIGAAGRLPTERVLQPAEWNARVRARSRDK